jgi:hypothetical protein
MLDEGLVERADRLRGAAASGGQEATAALPYVGTGLGIGGAALLSSDLS